MERIDPQKGAKVERLERTAKINVVRHGPASYTVEGFVGNPEEADDLNVLQGEAYKEATEEAREVGRAEAIAAVRKTAEELADSIAEDEEVAIWSSPTARTQHTATIIRDVLEERGKLVRRKAAESGIKVFDRFEDVRNYNDTFYQTIVSGGELEINGKKLVIDQQQTNPEGLHPTQYFVQDRLKAIPKEVLETWPDELVWFVENMERYEAASKRIWGPMERLAKVGDKKRRVILITHAGLADILIRSVDPETEEIIEPAEYVTLEQTGNGFEVTRPSVDMGDN